MLLVLFCLTVPAAAEETAETGTEAGEVSWNVYGNTEWYFEESTGILTIRGTGAIPAAEESAHPWYECRTQVTEIVIEEGITEIPTGTFGQEYTVTKMHLPSTLTSIDHTDFLHSTTLTDFEAAEGGFYYTVDGVLFSDDGTTVTLECYPFGRRSLGAVDSYTVPDGVTNLGVRAFNRSLIKNLVLPDSLCVLEKYSLAWMDLLESLDLPDIRTYNNNFWELNALKTVTVRDGSTMLTVEDNVLYTSDQATMLLYPLSDARTSFTVPEGVASMPGEAIALSKNLTELNLPTTLRYIRNLSIHTGSTSLAAVNVDEKNQYWCSKNGVLFSEDMTTLEFYPVWHANTSFTIPDTVTTVSFAAFFSVRNLKTLYIGENVTSFEYGTFDALEAIYFPGDRPDYLSTMFDCANANLMLYYPEGNTTWSAAETVRGTDYKTASYVPDNSVVDDEGNVWYPLDNILWRFDEEAETLYISGDGKIPDYSYAKYPWYAYYEGIRHLVIGEGITVVPDEIVPAIRDYTLETVSLPSTLTSVDVWSFKFADTLTGFTVAGGGVYYAEDGVLFLSDGEDTTLVCYPAGKGNSYTIPEGVTKIGQYSICAYNLETLVLPESLLVIDYNAIHNKAVTTLHIPAGTEAIGQSAFTRMEALESITVDENNAYYTAQDGILYSKDMTIIHTYPSGKTDEEFSIPDGVVMMPDTLYRTQRHLKTLHISAALKRIENLNMYTASASVTTITTDADNPNFKAVDNVLYSKDMSRIIHYPYAKTDEVYRIPDSVASIDAAAMLSAKYITELHIGRNLSEVMRAFNAPNLTAVYFPGDVPSWMNTAFTKTASAATMYYPEGNPTWTDGTMTIDGTTYTTAAYTLEPADVTWNTWENVQWYLDAETGVLTIDGEGAIPDVNASEHPWYDQIGSIGTVIIDSGITEVPSTMLTSQYSGVRTLYLANTVEKIDCTFFRYMNYLSTINTEYGGKYYSVDNVLFSDDGTDVTLEAFVRMLTIKSYTVPEGVTAIADYAFTNTYMTSLTLPGTLTTIGRYAFDLSGLYNVTISASVTSIDYTAFQQCSKLLTIKTAEDNPAYTAVDGVLFSKDMTVLHTYPANRGYTSYTIPETVTLMSAGVFYNNRYLTSLHIPSGVTGLIESGFTTRGWCTGITVDENNHSFCAVDGVLFNKDMTEILYYPPERSAGIYKIPDSVTTIAAGCFRDLANLTRLYMGENVTAVNDVLLSYHPVLTEIVFPGDLPEYFTDAFWASTWFGGLDDITFLYPETASGWNSPTMTIDGGTYNTAAYTPDENGLVWDTWENTEWCFDPTDAVLYINGEGAIPSLDTEDAYPWYSCVGSARSIIVGEGITVIPKYALNDVDIIESISLPSTLTQIEYFYRWNSSRTLREITVGEGGAFFAEDNVLFWNDGENIRLILYPRGKTDTTYTVPEGVTVLQTASLEFEEYLTGLILPESLTTIESGALGCRQITELHIPAGVTEIGEYAFFICPKLAAITVDEANPCFCSRDGVLYNKEMTVLCLYPASGEASEYHIPYTVTTIAQNAFAEIYNLESLYMGYNVSVIEGNMLEKSGVLTSIYFPGAVPSYLSAFAESAMSGGMNGITLYYLEGQTGWASPELNIYNVTFNTAVYAIETTAGDISADDAIDEEDAAILTQVFAGETTEIADENAADVDGDGELTRRDAMILSRYAAGWEGYDEMISGNE